jgi:DNA adenine methylase
MAQPFIKWVGGKRQLLPQIIPLIPKQYNRYFEPFVGGGALFFHLEPRNAILGDMNGRLVATYRGIRDNPKDVYRLLCHMPNSKDFFLATRSKDTSSFSDIEMAAWFLYLNRTGFNGMYRVNKADIFNVPFGKYANPNIANKSLLKECSRVLQGTRIHHRSYVDLTQKAKEGDFVYFDPPYAPLSASSSFTSYTKDGFDVKDQRQLRDTFKDLKERGVHCVLSNSSAPLIYHLYRKFNIMEVDASRNVNCKAEGRKKIKELLITLWLNESFLLFYPTDSTYLQSM